MTDLPPSPSSSPSPSPLVNAIVESISTLVITTADEGNGNNDSTDMQLAEQLVKDLTNPDLQENALTELAKKKEMFPDLGPLLWNTFGIIAILVQEVLAMYPALSPPILTSAQSCRVGYALSLMQCVASHTATRMLFLNAEVLFFLYPLVNCSSNLMPCEYLRLTSLEVIRALVKVPDTSVITSAHSSKIIPLCLAAMEKGNEQSKSVAMLIVKKILFIESGLDYACSSAENFYTMSRALEKMMTNLGNQPSPRLLKHITGCYFRLSTNPRACDALAATIPNILKDGTFASLIRGDEVATTWLQQLLINLQQSRVGLLGHVLD